METRRYLAELIGTFILVGVGSLSVIAAIEAQVLPFVVVPFGFGLGLLAAIVVGGHVSGGHYNPAVTLAAFADKRLGAADAALYVVAQVIGALIASAMILVIRDRDAVALTANHPGSAIEALPAFVIEVVLTAIFVAVILTVTKRAASQATYVIPLTLVAIHFAAVPLSGASVNPARSLGPALVGGNLDDLWIYLTAPFVGAIVGWLSFKVLDVGAEYEDEARPLTAR
jgi:aquaporin Z